MSAVHDDQLYHPWGIVDPGFWVGVRTEVIQPRPSGGPAADAEQQSVPETYRDRIAAITSAFSSKDPARLEEAATGAEKLDAEMTAEFGEQHMHTVNMRELRGWLAHLMGQQATAARWYLHTTGLLAILRGPDHQLTRESMKRARAMWFAIADSAEAHAVGAELLPMLAAVTGPDSKETVSLRRRLQQLEHAGGEESPG